MCGDAPLALPVVRGAFLRLHLVRSVSPRPTNGHSSSVRLTAEPVRAYMSLPTAAARVGACGPIGGSWKVVVLRRLDPRRVDGQRERPPHLCPRRAFVLSMRSR